MGVKYLHDGEDVAGDGYENEVKADQPCWPVRRDEDGAGLDVT